MNIKTTFPYSVREIENTWIVLSDGCRLAARIWLPETAENQPVPALLEYLPYRKSDGTAMRDALRHPYFAGHGYASVRVDMRGSGDSDGILYDEYLLTEQNDALEVLRWMAAQPWCDGNIGMFGKSWGGFNGLQIAARRPPELKAIITICSTDDRYADDVHYMGGCLLGSEMLSWASVMLALNATPPDPRWVGERWREMWLERLEKTPPFIEAWLTHQERDDFWKHGSVCEDFAAITCPVYAVGGWMDGYSNAIPRLLAGLTCPRKGLIGPWAHEFPETGIPGPAIGFLQESLRWWDHWLKGIDTGIMDEPMLRAWMLDSFRPFPFHQQLSGRWVAERDWPSPTITMQMYELTEEQGEKSEGAKKFVGQQSCGLEAGVWCAYGNEGDFPVDQRAEDGRSLTFTLPSAIENQPVLGFPEVTLTVAVDKPNALLAVRLCDIFPDGTSNLVSWGLLNLTHRYGHEQPSLLTPGEKMTVTIPLNAIGYVLPAGHCWRVAISPTYWPHAWPSPEVVTLMLYGGELHLPIRPFCPQDDELPDFPPAETSVLLPVEIVYPEKYGRFLTHDLISGTSTLTSETDEGCVRFPGDMTTDEQSRLIYTIREGDPLSAEAICQRTVAFQRGEWSVRIETESSMTADSSNFYSVNTVRAYEGETLVWEKIRPFNTPRHWV